jgi:hypothetical protein
MRIQAVASRRSLPCSRKATACLRETVGYVLLPLIPVDERFQQKARKLQGGSRSALCVLQFRKDPPNHPLHPYNGGWRDGFRLDCIRSRWYGGGVSDRIEQLRIAVKTMHRCRASHEASTPVLETFRKQKVWEDVVESFALTGHPKTKRCYAWSFQDKGETQYVTALEIPPIESTITAVRAAIVADEKRNRKAA